jgi:hypothetical protein
LTAYTVTTAKDILGDTTPGEVTLRDVLTALNGTPSGNATVIGTASNSITFAIGPAGSKQTIAVGSGNTATPLPAITRQVLLDGGSLITLNGANAGASANGLTLGVISSGSTVRGLTIEEFGGNGIEVDGTRQNVIAGDFIGTDSAGTTGVGNGNDGVLISASTANTIGGTTSGAGNVISGNAFNGVEISGSTDNVVLGNRLGTDASGSVALGNQNGVLLGQSAGLNTIGGNTAAAGNVISGNTAAGVQLQDGGTSDNLVRGNLIGTDVTGTAALGNGMQGIYMLNGAQSNTVGGTATGAGNVISGNGGNGVEIDFADTAGNLVLGNFIGTDKTGSKPLGNAGDGVLLFFGSTVNTIGAPAAGAGNVISANGGNGVEITGGEGASTSGNTIEGNLIGTDVSGKKALGNVGDGVFSDSASRNTLGGTASGAANVISANGGNGVELSGASIFSVVGNRIGTDKSGTAALGNRGDGVLLELGASQNTIGGTTTGSGNSIALNAKGVVVRDAASIDDSILGNSIWGNTGLGIDLGDDGHTANGANPRAFPNHGQNAPVIMAVAASAVSFTLTSTPRTNFRVELFASPAPGPTFQGQVFLGAVNVNTGTGGIAYCGTPVSAIPAGDIVTATATNLTTGDTSEYSQAATSLIVYPPILSTVGSSIIVTLSVQVLVGYAPAVGGMVTVSVAGLLKPVTLSVGANGVAQVSFPIPATTPVGAYTITANYLGTPQFLASSGTGELSILPPPTRGRRNGP